MLNSTHCNSSQELEEVSNTLRMVALTAETMTAARMSQARRLPSQVFMASIARVSGSNAFRTASRAPKSYSPLRAGRAGRRVIILDVPRLGPPRPSRPTNPNAGRPVNGEIGYRG